MSTTTAPVVMTDQKTAAPSTAPPPDEADTLVTCTKCEKVKPKREMHWVRWSYGEPPNQSFEVEYWCKSTARECEPCFL